MPYVYIERHIAPRAVEFYCPTQQGHRVVRVYLDQPTPKIYGFNESSSHRTPAVLWWSEMTDLIDRACTICQISNPLHGEPSV